MRYRRLGNSGLLISAIGLGTNNFGSRMDADDAREVLDACVDLGINFVDTADIYSRGVSEEYIGSAIEGRRDQFVLATKVGMRFADEPNGAGLSASHIKDSVEGSLRRLRTDYIDLYQTHIVDPLTPIEETLRALDDLVREGKVRYIGCSNYMAWEMTQAIHISRQYGWAQFVTAQPEYSMLVRDVEHELLHACTVYDVGILPYFPLAAGFLTGKYQRGQELPEGARLTIGPERMRQSRLTDENFEILESLRRFAESRGRTMVDLAFAWLLARPEVRSVIAGASNPDQLAQNAAACEWDLSDEDMAEIEEILPNTPGKGVGNLTARRGL
ncbi:MAG: aldo/keto reductase [Chloroflexota bacterium]